MRLQILDAARDDLIEGFYFYEKQEPGSGDYFLTSPYSDMEALKILFGIHPKTYRSFHRALSNWRDDARDRTLRRLKSTRV